MLKWFVFLLTMHVYLLFYFLGLGLGEVMTNNPRKYLLNHCPLGFLNMHHPVVFNAIAKHHDTLRQILSM